MKNLSAIIYRMKAKFSTSARYRSVCWPTPSYGPTETQRSELMNGINVVAAKTSGTLMTACTVMFQAGSRYEINDDLGSTHFLRAASTGSGFGATAFSKMRILQQNGAYLTCTSDRQSIAYTLRCPFPVFEELKYYLLDTAARCRYHNWEVSDVKPLVRGDITRVHPEQRVIDLVQRACWAGPLANSIFCEDERIDDMTGDMLRNYVKTNFKCTGCSVASIGVPFEETLKIAEKIDRRRDRPPSDYHPPSYPRAGFEYYDLGSGSDTWIAVAVPGCGTNDLYDLSKHAIVAAACGTENIQEGQHEFNEVAQPPLGLMRGNDIFTNFKAFNISYAETGVFGIAAKTRSSTARRTAFAVSEFLANIGELDFKQIAVGKKRLLLNLAFHEEDFVKTSEGLALQAANNIQFDNIENYMKMIDSISVDEIKTTAMSLSCKYANMAVAIVGDLGVVPSEKDLIKR